MNKKISLLASICVILVLFIFSFFIINDENSSSTSFKEKAYLKVDEQILKVTLAITPKAQAKGLSGRKELKQDEGMLFVFDKSSQHEFWMKDMNFPIDIIWIGEDMKVVDIAHSVSPESYPDSFAPDKNARYVLETVAGFAQKNNLKIGDEVQPLEL